MGKRENTKIVVDGFKENKSDDDILQSLFTDAGVPFGELRTVFNDIVKEKELRLSAKDRKIKTEELMNGVEAIADAEAMLKFVAMLQTKLKVTSTKAMGSLRTWAKANKVELPKAPRAESKRKVGFGGHYAKILDYVIAERDAFTGEGVYAPDKKEIVAFCHKNNIPEAYSTQALNVVHFAKRWNGEIAEETAEAPAEEKAA